MQILCSIVERRTARRLVAAMSMLGLSCALNGCRGDAAEPSGTEGQALREIASVKDSNPDPDIVEFTLTAAPMQYEFLPGKSTSVLAYNGQLPGPTIEAKVGDLVIVHFKNNMALPTTVHWHGIRLRPEMDGGPLSQELVPPGGSFEYEFTVPDAGLYWYHPHHLEEEEIHSGLYGAIRVRAESEPQFTNERLLVLSDVNVDSAGQLVQMDMETDDPYMQALGLEGNLQLVNGQVMPEIRLRKGGRERWRVLNAAGARYFRLAAPGHQLTLIGVDGGLIEAPLQQESVLLAPGERADIVLDSGREAATPGSLLNASYARLQDTIFTPNPDQPIAQLVYDGMPPVELPLIPDPLREIETLPAPETQRSITLNAKLVPELPMPELGASALSPPSRSEPLASGHSTHAMDMGEGGGHGGDGTAFMINGNVWPNVAVITSKLGATEEWEIYNHTQMDHPFHMHGFHFQVLDLNGEPWPYRGWKDTVNVPAGNFGENRLHLLVRYDGYPGQWLYHCHILHHNMMGMMAEFDIEE